MKAVIMAGGEGTRLRPLTSNQPKPMLPMANLPMMEHVVNLLRQHGFEDIVVTVAFMANAIRTYFGDGSEFGVRMVYATEATPLGTAGSVRNARDELDERFLVISGDVLTDIDLDPGGRLPRRARRPGHPGAQGGGQPARVRDRHHRRGRLDRALPREAHLGPGVQRHHQHRDLRARAGDLRLHPRGPGRSTSRASRSPRPWRPGRRCSGTSPTATGRTWARSRPTSRPTRTSWTRRSRWTSPASSCGPGSGWARARRSTRASSSTARRSSATTASIGPGARLGEYCTLGPQRPDRRQRRPRALGRPRQHLPRARASASTAACSAGAPTCARASAARRASSSATSASWAPTPRSRPGSRSTRSRRSRPGPSSTRRSSGSRGAPGPCSAGTASRAWPTSTSARSWPCACPWPGPPRSRRAPRSPPRATPAGRPGCSSGPSWSAATPPASTSTTSRRPPCRSPASRSPRRTSMAGVTVRLAPDDPQSVVLRFFDEEGIDVDEATQRKIERLYHREDFRRVLAREIGDIGFPPRSLEHYTAALIDSVDLSNAREADLKLVLDYSFGTASFVMPNLLGQARGRGAGGQPVRQHGRRRSPSTARPARPGCPSWCGRRAPIWAPSSTPGASTWPSSTTPGHALTDDEALLVLLTLVTEAHPGGPGGPAGGGQRGGRGDLPEGRGRDRLDQAVGLAPDGGGPHRAGRPWPPASRAASSSPPSCPPTTPPPPWSTCWPCSPPPGGSSPTWWPTCPPVHIAHQEVHTPWDQKGMVMRTLVERSAGTGPGPGRRGQGARGRRLGPGPARPRGAADPRLGRGGRATPRPRPGPRSTPSGSSSSCADRPVGRRWRPAPTSAARRTRSGIVRSYERARRTPVLDRPRVGPDRR